MKNTIAQCKGRGNYLNTIYYSTPQCLRGFTSILGKHQVSYLANFTNRQHLRVPTEFLARAGRARPHTSCQPYSSTEPRLPLHDGRATSPESPSVSCCTTGGRLTRDTSAFLLPRRAGDLPETPRVTPNGGCLPYPRPHPVRIACACRRAGAYMPAPLLRPAPLLGTFFLITECSCSNECQMLQRLAIFIRAVGRVAAQADSTTACQNALTRRKLAIRLLVGKQSFVQIAPTCESPRGLCQTLPRYKPTIAPPLMRIILMSLPTFRS